MKIGDKVLVDGKKFMYFVAEKGDALELALNGQTELISRSRATLSHGSDLAVTAHDDPFLDLVAQFKGLIVKLDRRADEAEAGAKKHRAQVRRLERVVRMLAAEESPPAAGRGWSPAQRAAASERMRKRNAARAEVEAGAGTDASG